ncbi:uncharacterized protein LOC143118917 isoform X2 [Alosa pseudoharengus]|uniref:uncharacterized protein LOC143118917 isoform X2 n=1 Tax=Alosa pseudoharengus TaxID=34774 RepID=UPI003F8A0B87
MQTTGRTPSPPSHDSMSSSDSFLFSDSDPVEDDTDVFLSEGNAGRADTRSPSSSRSSLHGDTMSSPSLRWASDGPGQCERSALVTGLRPTPLSSSVSSSSTSGVWSASESEGGSERNSQSHGDQLFAQKCLELQCFVTPLLELLHGLKNGRFDKGLSSFQQSVAMDRIQRIVGVLQKPNSGEKYLNTLLQVEMMLKLWFPQISALASPAAQSTAASQTTATCSAPSTANSSSTPPHKHKDQLHMPVKRRLSWSDTDSSSTPSPILCKRFQLAGDPGPSPERESSSSALNHHRHAEQRCSDSADEPSSPPAPRWSEPSLTWVHVAPIPSPRKSCSGVAGAGPGAGAKGSSAVMVALPQSSRGSPAMQDSSISSTTPLLQPSSPQLQPSVEAADPPGHTPRDPTHDSPLQGKGQATAPPITTRPLSRVESGALPNPVQS